MRLRFLLALCLSPFLLTTITASGPGANAVPSWFNRNPNDPHAIFSAWRNLSAREAALFLGNGWTVLGGQLRDQEGKPLALTPITIYYNAVIRSFSATLMTDRDGYFLIYSPYSLDVRGPGTESMSQGRFCLISAAPGYPPTELGMAYAASKREVRVAAAQPLLREADRAFYALTVEGHNTFDERGFAAFRAEMLARPMPADPAPFRDLLRPRQGSIEGRKRTAYRIRVVSPDGRPVPQALIKYQAYDGYEGNVQVVETDRNGMCEVEEYVLEGREASYYAGIRRIITVDAPGFAVGPVTASLREEGVNEIVLPAPAKVSGRIADHRGNPIWMHLTVEYRRPTLLAFETHIRQRADGSFSFDRIMPGEEFRLVARGLSHQSTPRAPVASGFMTLPPGGERIVNLEIPLAAALRVLVTDEQGQPVGSDLSLTLLFEDGTRWSGIPDSSGAGRFGFSALGQVPFRIQVKVRVFQEHISEIIRLEPGELKLAQIRIAVQNE